MIPAGTEERPAAARTPSAVLPPLAARYSIPAFCPVFLSGAPPIVYGLALRVQAAQSNLGLPG